MKLSLSSILLLFAASLHAQTWDATYACPAGNTIGFVVTGATNEPVRWSWVGKIRVVTNAASVPSASYLIRQGFEGTGYDNSETWTAAGNIVDPDYTGTALEGSQSLRLQGTNSTPTTYATFASSTNVEFYCLFRPDALPSGGSRNIVLLKQGTTQKAFVNLTTSGALNIQCGSASQTTTATMTASNTYSVWFGYNTNGTAWCAFNTNATLPGVGNYYKTFSNGSNHDPIDRVALGGLTADTFNWIYDKVRVATSTIGSDPQ